MRFQEILQQAGVPFRTYGQHHHARKGWVQFDCPYCSPSSQHFRMGFKESGRYCACWKCGPHNLLETVKTVTGKSASECYTLIGGIDFSRIRELRKPPGALKIPEGVGSLHEAHINYLLKRRFNPPDIEHLWKIKGIGLQKRLKWRIFIPIYYLGEVVSWTTRIASDNAPGPKYITAEPQEERIFHKDLLYGEDYCGHTIIVCEGPTDVWRIGPGAVCTFGTGFSSAQVLKMVKYPRRVVCFDAEPEAQLRARNLCDRLSPFPGETCRVELDEGDPGSLGVLGVQQLRREFLDSEVGGAA